MINLLVGFIVGVLLCVLGYLTAERVSERLGKPVNDDDAEKLREIVERNGK